MFVSCLLLTAGVQALVPSTTPRSVENAASRRSILVSTTNSVAAAVLVASAPALAEETAVATPPPAPEAAPAPEFPTDWGLTQDYYTDAAKVVAHMRLATSLDKGAPNMENIAKNTKKEMIEFVSFYRRFTNVAGKQSFSTLYTSINVLAGHYTSYGPKFPVPEKRRKRLYQEYTEIEKNIKKRR